MRHLANAVKNRKNQREETQRARRMSCGSDGFDVDVDMAEEASDEEGYDDELFRRIAVTLNQRDHDARFRRTYRREVGSSFDLTSADDPERWEAEAQFEDQLLAELHALEAEDELNAYADEAKVQDMVDPEIEAMFESDGFFEGLSNEELELLGIVSPNARGGKEDMDVG